MRVVINKRCSKCNTLIQVTGPGTKSTCPKCTPSGWQAHKQARIERFGKELYDDKRWRKVRQQVVQADHGLCRVCFHEGKYTPYADVDHVRPVAMLPPGADVLTAFFNRDACQCLCKACHEHKTRQDRQGILSNFLVPVSEMLRR